MTATAAKNRPALVTTAGARAVALSRIELTLGEFVNARTDTGLEDDDIQTLAASIWDSGLWDPLLVLRVEPDLAGQTNAEVMVLHELAIDGQRRVKALRLLAKQGKISADQLIPVVDLPGPKPWAMVVGKSVVELKEMALRVGLHREGLSSYELLVAATDLITRGRTQAQASLAIGRSEAWLSKMLAAWRVATPDLKESLRKGKITDEQFKELATVKPEKQPEAVKEIVTLRERGSQGKKEAFDKSRQVAGLPAKLRSPPAGKTTRAAAAPLVAIGRSARGLDVSTAEIVSLAKIEKPLDQYTKGVFDMCRVMQGEIHTTDLGKPFKHWLGRVQKAMQKKLPKTPKPLKLSKPYKDAVTKGGKKVAIAAPAKRGGAKSKACTARHHSRCQNKQTCGCDCHGGK